MSLPRHEAERLLAVATGRSRTELVTGRPLDDAERARYDELVARRLAGEPLQYLEGTVDFGPLTLRCDRRALIPRPETEQFYDMVTRTLRDHPPAVVVDLCTGSGNLALALKHDLPTSRVIGTDASAVALSLARENSELTGIGVEWREGDLFAALPAELLGSVGAIVTNPPYVADLADLPSEVAKHEPVAALRAGPDGLNVLRGIAAAAAQWLAPGGLIACEIGADQGDRAAALFAEFSGVVGRDLSGRDRWVVGFAP